MVHVTNTLYIPISIQYSVSVDWVHKRKNFFWPSCCQITLSRTPDPNVLRNGNTNVSKTRIPYDKPNFYLDFMLAYNQLGFIIFVIKLINNVTSLLTYSFYK